jgi:hypothetical protein
MSGDAMPGLEFTSAKGPREFVRLGPSSRNIGGMHR